jgi:ABC-type phosphate/phosphonate transport system substrate-binding protein
MALDALRDGLRPFVVKVLEEKEGPLWHHLPRIQRLVPTPPQLGDEPPYGDEGPVLDTALLLKIIDSDSYWYRTFRRRMPGVSRWVVGSLRELRNRVSHNDGTDPLFHDRVLALQYLSHIEVVLRSIDSPETHRLPPLMAPLRSTPWSLFLQLSTGRSRWSLLYWFGISIGLVTGVWSIRYFSSERISQATLVIGTPDTRLERYQPVAEALEQRLRLANPLLDLLGQRVDVRVETAASYPEAISWLHRHHWDVLLGFSPVVSMEALEHGYRPIGVMFPDEPLYYSIFYAKRTSNLSSLADLMFNSRIALGDYFSATKYYVPMSLLKGRTLRVIPNQSTAQILSLVRGGNADVGVIAGDPQHFSRLNPDLKVVGISSLLPQSIVAISPSLSDRDSDVLREALPALPVKVRSRDTGNFAAGAKPDYRRLRRQVDEGRALSACLSKAGEQLTLSCPPSRRIIALEGWIESVELQQEQLKIRGRMIDGHPFQMIASSNLLAQVVSFQLLDELRGKRIRARVPVQDRIPLTFSVHNPNQIEILP